MARKGSLLRMDFKGGKELEQALLDLGSSAAIRRTLKRVVLKALIPVALEAEARAPRNQDGDGFRPIHENIEISSQLSRRQKRGTERAGPNEARAYVGVRAGVAGKAVLAEFGTVLRHWRTGKSTGAARAQPFMRPAWDNNKWDVLETIEEDLWEEIERTAKQIARRQANLLRKKR